MTITRPGFKRTAGVQYPARVNGVSPILVETAGGVITISLDTPTVAEAILGGTCWVWQLKMALQSSGDLHAVDAAVPADVTDQINIIWTNGWRTEQGDLLSAFVQTTLGKTDPRMTTLYALAAEMTY